MYLNQLLKKKEKQMRFSGANIKPCFIYNWPLSFFDTLRVPKIVHSLKGGV
jgi:hypothetical protein